MASRPFQSASRTEKHCQPIFLQILASCMIHYDDELRSELRKRLDVERRGLQYVSAEDEPCRSVASPREIYLGKKFSEAKRFG